MPGKRPNVTWLAVWQWYDCPSAGEATQCYVIGSVAMIRLSQCRGSDPMLRDWQCGNDTIVPVPGKRPNVTWLAVWQWYDCPSAGEATQCYVTGSVAIIRLSQCRGSDPMLRDWQCGNNTIVPVPGKRPWKCWWIDHTDARRPIRQPNVTKSNETGSIFHGVCLYLLSRSSATILLIGQMWLQLSTQHLKHYIYIFMDYIVNILWVMVVWHWFNCHGDCKARLSYIPIFSDNGDDDHGDVNDHDGYHKYQCSKSL